MLSSARSAHEQSLQPAPQSNTLQSNRPDGESIAYLHFNFVVLDFVSGHGSAVLFDSSSTYRNRSRYWTRLENLANTCRKRKKEQFSMSEQSGDRIQQSKFAQTAALSL